MNLYSVNFIHYSPKDSEKGIYGYVIANDDEGVYELIKSELQFHQGQTLWNSYEDREEEEYELFDNDYNVIGIETFKDRMIRLRGEMYDEDAEVSDAYYGVTHYGWSLIKENVADSEISTLKFLNII